MAPRSRLRATEMALVASLKAPFRVVIYSHNTTRTGGYVDYGVLTPASSAVVTPLASRQKRVLVRCTSTHVAYELLFRQYFGHLLLILRDVKQNDLHDPRDTDHIDNI